ncbi:branched-chain amino acid ABC transporter permease [Haloglomus litoreum]|uniref:branched-chain amino acid ABC transporter permease n=1 Tax=Haloglomus litoreum TaxID=3034026 RepID=UPI0023E8DCF9|nr:branched-chain amino acid ABC transporter permease [Haloglomus sp. DT116]
MALVENLAVSLLNGIVWGTIIALIALGLNLIFGLLEIINLTHGSFYMLGAVGGYFVIDATGSFWLALFAAPLVVGFVGVAMERTVLQPIAEDIPLTVIATFGMILVFQHLALVMFGSGVRTLESPIKASIDLGVASYSLYRLSIAVVAVVFIVLLHLFLTRTRPGLWMRGVRQDREMADALGVPTDRVYMLTFGLGTFLAAMAGVLLAPVAGVSHLMGIEILAVAFIVVIVGGLGSFRGVLVASLLFALVENLGSAFIPATEARIFTLVLMAGIVLVKPEGFYGGTA